LSSEPSADMAEQKEGSYSTREEGLLDPWLFIRLKECVDTRVDWSSLVLEWWS
jgi:hypothetical protein